MKDASQKKRGRSASPAKTPKAPAVQPLDILNPIVIKNIYYVTHNASEGLSRLGFAWEGGGKKKKKGKKKK